jgi:N-acetylglucosamine-6-phosphate deacetylase
VVEPYIIRNARVLLPYRVVEGGSVRVVDGRIAEVADHDLSSNGDGRAIDAEGRFLAPGFVELHIHGCDKLGFESAEPDALSRIRDFLLAHGVTTFVPTLQCDLGALSRLASAIENDESLARRIPGLYVEGPFVSTDKRGGILPGTLREPKIDHLEEVVGAARGMLRLMTVAPELEGIDEIVHRLVELGVIPCWGHTNCTIEEVPRLGDVRCNITHLFNGMSPISHKQSGLSLLPFLDPEVFCEVNGDGVHLNAETIRMCQRHLNPDRMILISDAVISAGRGHGEFRYFDRRVVSSESGVRYQDGTLIGSNCLIPEVVRRFIETTGCALHDAVRLATLNPCRLLGIDGRRGSVEAGKDADLVLFDENLSVTRVFATEDVPSLA